jgi:signal transduction histidine kinase
MPRCARGAADRTRHRRGSHASLKAGGAGIGLAVVAEIMQAHGGFVVLDNSVSGASLRLLFPIARQKGAAK